MTEATQVNDAVRRYLGPLGAFRRLEVPAQRGWPDWHWSMRGRSGWIEAKLMTVGGLPEKLTLDQVLFGETETLHGGPWAWYLLGLQPRRRAWHLFDAGGVRALFERREAIPIFAAVGAFPTREIVRSLMREN